MTKKIYFFAVMTALFLLAPATLRAASSGDCGDNVKWNLDDQGVLTIEGTGAMTDFASMSNIPWNRSAVTTVVIKEGVTTIGSLAFNNCTKLTSVTISNTVTSIGSGAFATNQKLTSVDIPNSVTTIGEAAFNSCTGLTSVTLPNSLTSIADWSFSECTGLTSVEIPNSVTSIGQGAFSQCSSLASVNIPNSVTSIGVGAFGYTGLTKIESLAENPPVCGKNAFAGIDKGVCKLYVPEKSIEAYKAADGWKDFINVVTGISSVSKDNNAAVSAKNGAITVTGTAGNALVEVYSTSGALVYRGTSKTVAVPSAGIYVVKAAGKTVKVNAAK